MIATAEKDKLNAPANDSSSRVYQKQIIKEKNEDKVKKGV